MHHLAEQLRGMPEAYAKYKGLGNERVRRQVLAYLDQAAARQ